MALALNNTDVNQKDSVVTAIDAQKSSFWNLGATTPALTALLAHSIMSIYVILQELQAAMYKQLQNGLDMAQKFARMQAEFKKASILDSAAATKLDGFGSMASGGLAGLGEVACTTAIVPMKPRTITIPNKIPRIGGKSFQPTGKTAYKLDAVSNKIKDLEENSKTLQAAKAAAPKKVEDVANMTPKEAKLKEEETLNKQKTARENIAKHFALNDIKETALDEPFTHESPYAKAKKSDVEGEAPKAASKEEIQKAFEKDVEILANGDGKQLAELEKDIQDRKRELNNKSTDLNREQQELFMGRRAIFGQFLGGVTQSSFKVASSDQQVNQAKDEKASALSEFTQRAIDRSLDSNSKTLSTFDSTRSGLEQIYAEIASAQSRG